ncbi:MAG: hypothetical protein K8L91_16920 [Anaerolineae bacterium]|nr:hypothetical protein [Anaerolineae bacterium]
MTIPPDDPFDLIGRLDELIPPNQAGAVSQNNDPLIEIARRITELPRLTLPESSVASIEARLRDAALTLGTPRPRLSRWGRRHILLSTATVMLVTALLWVIFDTDPDDNTNLPISTDTPTLTATATVTASSTVTPTPTFTPSLTSTASVTPPPTITPTPAPVGTLVIEGPVEVVDGTTVVIYDILVQLDPHDPLTPSIRVGDLLHVEGEIGVVGNRIVVLATVTVLIEVEVYISDSGEIFRDDAPCDTPPPAWAPAYRWRARCEGGQPPSEGMGMGDNDD